ncbi:MAG: tail fiber domain-containing protein [Planctomycetia bacterium]|nr:MAG: tail fiber domain-containing protein [Planctomycetia bacterium]
MVRRLCILTLATPLLALPALAQAPLATAFTYQGRLDDGGAPANGSFDLRFRLFDDAAGGAQIGATICADNVAVAAGTFATPLDFGSTFDGNARWLEVSVRPDATPGNCGGGAYTPLTPRQPLSAAPYALHALNAGQWQNSGSTIMNANNGFVGINRDYTVGLEWFGVHAPVNSGYGGMYVTTEGDDAWPFYGYKAGTGQVGWTFLDGASGDWHLNLDGIKLTVRDEGFVGIRTSVPMHPLHVVTINTDRAIYGENSVTGGAAIRGHATHTGSQNTGVWGQAAGTTGRAVFGDAAAASGANFGGFFRSASTSGVGARGESPFVGIEGAASGANGVGVAGSGPSRGVTGSSATIGGDFLGTGNNSGGVYGVSSGTGGFTYGVFGEVTNPASAGIGVRGRAPSYGVQGEATGNGVGVVGRAPTGIGVYGESSSVGGTGVLGANAAGSGTTYGVQGVVNSPSGYAGHFSGRGYFSGNVGIGVLSPTNPLSVVGDADISGRVSIGINGADARLLVRGVTGEDAFRVRVDGGTKMLVKDNGGVGIGSNFGTLPANGLRVQGSVGIGTDPTEALHVSGNIRATGSVFASCGTLICSDERFKTNVEPLRNGLDAVRALRPVRYDWRREQFPLHGFPAERQVGLIAQDVRAVAPDVVQKDGDGFLAVDYGRLTPLLIEAVKELEIRKDAELAALRADNEALAARIERLEALLAPAPKDAAACLDEPSTAADADGAQ